MTGASSTAVTLTVMVLGLCVQVDPAVRRAAVVLHLEGEARVACAVGIGAGRELADCRRDVAGRRCVCPAITAAPDKRQAAGARQRS